MKIQSRLRCRITAPGITCKYSLFPADEFDEIRIKLQIRTAAANVITNNTVINVDTLRTIITKLLRMCKITNMDVNEVVTLETGTGGAAGGVNCDNINQVVDGIYRDRELRRQILEFFATYNQIPNLSYNEDTEDDHTSFRTPPISHYALLNQLQTLDMTTTNNNNNDLAYSRHEVNHKNKLKHICTIFAHEQLERLESEFDKQQYIVGNERFYLATTLCLTEALVKALEEIRNMSFSQLVTRVKTTLVDVKKNIIIFFDYFKSALALMSVNVSSVKENVDNEYRRLPQNIQRQFLVSVRTNLFFVVPVEINELSPTSTAQTIDEEEKELLAPNLLSVRKKTLPNDIPRLDCGRFFLIVGKKRPQNGIVFKNYHFGMKRINKNGTQVWICTHKLCNAAINICNGSIVKTSSIKPDGSHEFEHQPKMSLDIYECIKSIKRRIEEEPTAAVSLLYDQQVKKFRRENGTAASIPVFDRVKSSLYEYRSSKQPPVPKALSSIDIPYRLTRTLLDQNFLLCNNQLVSVVGFASSIGIKLLGDNAHWNADGTFRTAPKLFYQSYSIHVWDNFSMKPVIYAALPNKNTNTYDTFLNELIVYAQINGISLTPKSILIDFEMAAHQAFSKNFPTAKIKGCQFHFGQNIWRQIKKKGLIS
ncbi:unnamed protein product [Rotaria socialis]|uniref:MULE transposase domain-containing protein n=1 Tax=Rotaria socialis TaxID=392032 RepID=A0A820SIQ0_9BILA|nr:unnamed protein product [Rotaria socialis]CAF4462535.1 unnamed protein product [Rotaria socialis]